MEQAVIVEGGVLTGEKIKIKNKTENSPKFQNSSSSTNSETAQENSASSSTNQYVPSSKRRHSAGKTWFYLFVFWGENFLSKCKQNYLLKCICFQSSVFKTDDSGIPQEKWSEDLCIDGLAQWVNKS